jgi:hypothetical protein
MTVAVCLECGQMKSGAWTPCPSCSFQPRGLEELAKSLMLSDNCIATATLTEFAARRQQGEPWNFGPELVERFKERVAAMIPLTADGLPVKQEHGAQRSPPPKT